MGMEVRASVWLGERTDRDPRMAIKGQRRCNCFYFILFYFCAVDDDEKKKN